MPYVHQNQRDALDDFVADLADRIMSPGEANYAISTLLLQAFQPERYDDFNEVIGILECAKLEFYRRAVSKYEDEKIKENGDVY